MDLNKTLDRSSEVLETTAYALVGAVLIAGAVVLVGQSIYEFVDTFADGVVNAAQALLDTLLLTFIFIELFGAVRVTLRERKLVAEPFFLVGIIAAIKEIVLLVGTEDLTEKSDEAFQHAVIEVGVLAGVVAVLTFCTFLMRRSRREPGETEA
jgi:uncharacterized membrane protein (DUF373 family)